MNHLSSLLDPLRQVKQHWQLAQKERLEIAPADVLFCSFPKSGRTWLRHILGNLLKDSFGLPANTSFLEVENLPSLHPGIPKIMFLHDDEPFWKTPDELRLKKNLYRQKKVILMVRHPADVIVSGYFEKTRRYVVHGSQKPAFEGSITDYVSSRHGSTDTLIRYLNIWAEESSRFPHFCLLRYEDLHENAFRQVKQIVEFLGIEAFASDAAIETAIANSSFENMREMERRDAFASFRLRPGDLSDPESFKTRKGKVGGYLDYLDKASMTYIADKINRELSGIYGYTM
ncbi:MAG: sulfotransferase domain-containing protein [Bacteroidota bacterium]